MSGSHLAFTIRAAKICVFSSARFTTAVVWRNICTILYFKPEYLSTERRGRIWMRPQNQRCQLPNSFP